jgi:hypothetical protein
VDVGKRFKRDRSIFQIGVRAAREAQAGRGRRDVVIEDLNQGVRKPVQIQFSGPDYRRLMSNHRDFMEKMKRIQGAVDVGLSEQEPKDELKIELDRGLANQPRHLGGRRRAGAARGLRRRGGGRLGRSHGRDARRRRCACTPTTACDASNIEHLPIAVSAAT